MMDKSVHFKLYKSGKKWLCMAIAVVATTAFFGTSSVNADTTSTNVNQNVADTTLVQNSSVSSSNAVIEQEADTEKNNDTTSTNISGENQVNNSSAEASTSMSNAATTVATPQNGWNTTHSQFYVDGQLANGYVQADDGNYYMFKDGVRQSGVQKWYGTYYDFDPTTYLRVDNNYVQSQWGLWYMFGNDGRIVSGRYDWMGSTYFFDPTTYLRVDNDYRSTESDGRGVLLGNDGIALTGVQKWMGTYYYFDPATKLRVDNNYVQSQWGDWYMFGSDGRIVSGFYNWQGTLYYFNPSTFLVTKNAFFNGNGSWGDWDDHYADANGRVHSLTYFSQFSPINAPEGCAAASLAMLLSVKNEWPGLSYLYSTLPQRGGVFSVGSFGGIIPIDSLVAYAKRFDSRIQSCKWASLATLSDVVLSGHPVLYYGWSSYERAYGNRNHAKIIIGAHNGLYHVIDPCYWGRWQRGHSMGGNAYDWGADSWQTWGSIASEYNGSALTINA